MTLEMEAEELAEVGVVGTVVGTGMAAVVVAGLEAWAMRFPFTQEHQVGLDEVAISFIRVWFLTMYRI